MADHGMTADEIEDLIASAEAAADSDWAVEFCADMGERFEQYGEDVYLSNRQIEKLAAIAEGER